ncbi:MAG TPA: HAMP domain-containing sensor histidine kinase [Steroidobacteraceae bacterium]|jgi:signal transduction histidine kinase|nr:HAMP domain-containing sensor histidine kinase [Steroidobacteraceae bacterium]
MGNAAVSTNGTGTGAPDTNRPARANFAFEGRPDDLIAPHPKQRFLVFRHRTTQLIDDGNASLEALEIEQATATRLEMEDLVAANRRKDEFLGVLGHELRSPLAAIQNAIHILSSQTAETPTRHRTHALIQRQVCQMGKLIDDLVDVSRIINGQLRVWCERIDLCAVLSNAIETLESDINERNHRLTVALPAAPIWLHADPCRLEQVFVNLLANASKYTDAGGELGVYLQTQEGQVTVRIQDSGIGIAPEVLPHIFDLFKQADEASLRSKSGLGIGLALVRNLVELHGGSVAATSGGRGQGSEFTVRLPR